MADGYAERRVGQRLPSWCPGLAFTTPDQVLLLPTHAPHPFCCLLARYLEVKSARGLDGLHEIVDQADLMKPITKYRKSIHATSRSARCG